MRPPPRSNNLGDTLYYDVNRVDYTGWSAPYKISYYDQGTGVWAHTTVTRIGSAVTLTGVTPNGTTSATLTSSSANITGITSAMNAIGFWVNDSGYNQFGNITVTQ